jgi:hypothetical protein
MPLAKLRRAVGYARSRQFGGLPPVRVWAVSQTKNLFHAYWNSNSSTRLNLKAAETVEEYRRPSLARIFGGSGADGGV